MNKLDWLHFPSNKMLINLAFTSFIGQNVQKMSKPYIHLGSDPVFIPGQVTLQHETMKPWNQNWNHV